jgi:hypothetical protein
MCCGPDHIGPPPGWHDGTAEVETRAEVRRRQLDALATVIRPPGQADPGPRPRRGPPPRSTEGGQGRAIPRDRVLLPGWTDEWVTDPGGDAIPWWSGPGWVAPRSGIL